MLNPDQLFNDRYLVLRQLADKGSATVYLATDKDAPDHQFAISEYRLNKVPQAQMPEALKLIEQTGNVITHLNHPHLQRVYEVLIVDQTPYVVAEYLSGETLEQQLRYNAGGLPEAQVTAWGLQLCDALTYLHTQTPPVIFAGLQPDGVLVMPDGSIMLMDYDITRALNFGVADNKTQVLSAPGYMPPEQYQDNKLGPFTDVYSLGMILLRLSTGFDPASTPFQAPRADTLKTTISHHFADVLAKATSQDYQARYQTIEEFALALRTHPIVALPTRASAPNKLLLFLGAAAGILVILAVLFIVLVLPALRRAAVAPIATPTTSIAGNAVATAAPEGTQVVQTTATVSAAVVAGTTASGPGKSYLPIVTFSPNVLYTDEDTVIIQLSDEVSMTLMRIPAGSFVMGSALLDSPDVHPEHTITLPEYLIGKYDVTNAQWAVFAQSSGISYTIPPGRDNYPVVNVSWDDATAFSKWLWLKTGLHTQLPTEAQWEKAARSTDGRLYPWGNNTYPGPKLINFDSNVHDATPVGKYSPGSDSAYMVADMAGNVWNWTSSLYKPYPYVADDGRESPQGSGKRVIRGGSYLMPAGLVASPIRGAALPTETSADWGFRVAAVSPGARKQTPPVVLPQTNALILTIQGGVGITLVKVPAGEFAMGGLEIDKNATANEKPEHKVKLDDYLIGKYDVTNAQYAVFAAATDRNWKIPDGKENEPVVNVTWDDAVAFCQWASQVSGRKVSLPTEAQWEKAARGTDGRFYPWGNQAPDNNLLNFNMKVGTTTPVGQFSPAGDGPFGSADMAGNVLQWTSTIAAAYPYKADDGREDPTSRAERVYRGSSYSDPAHAARVSVRAWQPPTFSNKFLGFRIVVASGS
ncbi:MAG TPA: bifunctional serine/threonine-protein kinase/formylglycine-generating enzyme family protein [Anaerolineae bacterium]